MGKKYLNRKLPLNASRGQKRLAQVLDEIFCTNGVAMTIWYEYSLDDMGDPQDAEYYGVAGMQVDFYIVELNTAIEYQGKQHYEFSSLFGSSQSRDERKREFLKDVGVRLVEVPYTIGDNFGADEIRELIFGRAEC